ncbi:MAG: AbrB family transcriptional regulator [Geminicoccaceae bacterium]
MALAAGGGALFAFLEIPLPWMLGAMAATTAGAMSGLPLRLPRQLRAPMVAVVGMLLGSGFTGALLRQMPDWLLSLASLPVYVLMLGAAVLLYLTRRVGLPPRTAFFAATPGGLGEMVLLAERYDADVRTIALTHATRILLIVFVVPFVARRFDAIGPGGGAMGFGTLPPLELAMLILAAGAGWIVAIGCRLPAPALIGSLLGSAALHALDLVAGAPPSWLVAVAQAVIGASIGARFSGFDIRAVLGTMRVGVVLTAIMFALAVPFVAALTALTGQPFVALLLAFVPGGLAEMSLVALSLGIDPAFVASHHLLRIALVVAGATPIYAWWSRRLKRNGRPEGRPSS